MQPETRRLSPRLELGLVIIPAIVLVIAFYFWTALSNGAKPDGASSVYYPLLARAFIHHHLYLGVKPDPELLALSDPYDPQLNKPYRLHDASLYHGRYYLYFGPTPAVLLFEPFALIARHDFPQKMAVPLFCSAGFLFSTLLFLLILQDYFSRTPLWLKLGCVLSLGMATICPFLIRRPDVYEVAIGCAYGLLQLTFFLFYLALRHPQRSLPWLILASACIGASVGARYNYATAAGVFGVVVIVLAWRKEAGRQNRAWELLFALVPLVLIGLSIAWYNQARFGNPLEFGQRYQLAGIEVAKTSLSRLNNVASNAWYYFFAPLYAFGKFPYVDASVGVVPDSYKVPAHYYGLEKVAGMFQVSPVTFFALTLPQLYRSAAGPVDRPLWATLALMASTTAAILVPVLLVSGATMRYMVDFVPVVVFLGCVMLCHFHAIYQKGGMGRWLFNGCAFVILLVGCANGLFLSFTGYYDYMRTDAPDTYAAVERFFQPLEFLLQGIAHLLTR